MSKPPFAGSATSFVCDFFSLLLAAYCIDRNILEQDELPGNLTILSYMGHGASGSLSTEDIRRFFDEQQSLWSLDATGDNNEF